MAVNSSSTNDSLVSPHPSTINLDPSADMDCFISRPNFFIFTTFYIFSIFLLLPLSILTLYHGLQQLRSSSAATMNHSDCFTYHMVIMELIGVLVYVLYFCAIIKEDFDIFTVGNYVRALNWHGQTFFHLLMCVERYLAVVHPITYRSLRNQRGVRFRNISIGCVWLLSLVGMCIRADINVLKIIDLGLMILTLVVVSFCSFSVLRVLIHPGPHEQVRERVDQFKRRAFYTIAAIMAVLLLRFAWGVLRYVIDVSKKPVLCLMVVCSTWINLPSSLVLPLLFLYRERKLMCWNDNIAVG